MKKFLSLVFLCVFSSSGCQTVDNLALNSMTNLLDYQHRSFLSEEDTTLAREAVAGNVKLMDGLLLQNPNNTKLQLLAGEAFFSYSFGYVETLNADRASRLYLRGLQAASKNIGGEKAFFETDPQDFQKQCLAAP